MGLRKSKLALSAPEERIIGRGVLEKLCGVVWFLSCFFFWMVLADLIEDVFLLVKPIILPV